MVGPEALKAPSFRFPALATGAVRAAALAVAATAMAIKVFEKVLREIRVFIGSLLGWGNVR